MIKILSTLPIVLATLPALFAQSYQLSVQNGYGSTMASPGDTVHIWAAEWGPGATFRRWAGDTAFLEMSDEWRTRVIMPAQDVTVAALTRPLPTGTGNYFTEEEIMGRDTLKQVFHYFPAGGPPKGVVWLWHGKGGSAAVWTQVDLEMQLFTDYLVANELAIIITESEEATKDAELNPDGNPHSYFWTIDSVANVDLANVRAIRDTFFNRGYMNWSTPMIAEGFSAGGAFSTLVATVLNWRAAITHNFQGISFIIPVTQTPILFSMAQNDNGPEVGLTGNMEAYDNHLTMLDNGVCAQFYLQRPSPLYPQRFKRIPGIGAAQSAGLAAELVANGCVNGEGYLTKSAPEIENLVIANPQNWPILLSLTPVQRNYVKDEVAVTITAHHFHTDFMAKDLRFINQLCAGPVAAPEPLQTAPLRLFPNPTNGWLNLPAGTTYAFVFDITGKTVLSKTAMESTALDVSALRPGLYFILSDKGRGKFVRQ